MKIDSQDLFIRVKKADVHIICTFLEGFENCSTVRTPRPEEGEFAVLQLMVSKDSKEQIRNALKTLKKKGIKLTYVAS